MAAITSTLRSERGAFQGSTLLVPSLSIGNVDQLAIDILLETLFQHSSVEHLGFLFSEHMSNIAGPSPFPGHEKSPATAHSLELYRVHAASPVLILQQRAAPKEGHHELWAHALTTWAVEQGVARIIVLSGSDASCRQDNLLAGQAGPWHVCSAGAEGEQAGEGAAGAWEGAIKGANSMDLPLMPGAESAAASAPVPSATGTSHWPTWTPLTPASHAHTLSRFLGLQSTGLGPLYFRRCCSGVGQQGESKTVPVLVLLQFVAEGDNRPEARELAAHAAGALSLYPAPLPASPMTGTGTGTCTPGPTMVEPAWWGKSLQGPGFEQLLYG